MAGLREHKKQATREALQTAALRLALEHGPGNVRVEEIAQAAGVSPRTYNNYFSSREQAIVSAITADRVTRTVAAVLHRPADVPLGVAVLDAVVPAYSGDPEASGAALLMVATTPALRTSYLDTVTGLEEPLAGAIVDRCGGVEALTARVLAAGVVAAIRVALEHWLRAATVPAALPGFVIPAGSLPEVVRAAVTALVPALNAAAPRPEPSG
ncbi:MULTISPECIES: TetR/AcrR family transcriptional regulator [Actinoplanes]|uniref:TetR/AcrR family transcriptional regulator n=1 Tax=Actinoplanes TaxID=1865 RepID=UPI0005F2A188|nr:MULTISPECIES: TetR/AcrR family transcriptional regulator [Actinoplanes]GLY07137.1 TetR family transcriptional regulator [Actinoplanes sp. NBRC 101535]